MSRLHHILKGTIILTATGLLTRFMGFFYRMFLSHSFGEDGVGLYQLIFPVYALGFSLTSAGIELAISRSVSKTYALGNKKRARDILYTGMILSLALSLLITLLLQKYSNLIAVHFLHNSETAKLLLLLSYVFPFAAIHSCIVGYYLGVKETKIPAISQLIEQSGRILSVLLIYKLSTIYNFKFQIIFSVLGIIIGEIFSALFCLKYISGKLLPASIPSLSHESFFSCTKELLTISCPVTANRVLLNLLQSIEATSIPLSLSLYGYDTAKALGIYGVLTGMALPCILFPSAITNAVSTMLLPTVAEIQALQNRSSLTHIMKKTIVSCTLLGSLCCAFFQIFGTFTGKFLFNSTLAGKFIVTLSWICPFIYTNNTLISMINGIGKTVISFIINTISLSIRIGSVLLIIPSYGIYGYLTGLLISQIFIFIACTMYLYRQFKAEVI